MLATSGSPSFNCKKVGTGQSCKKKASGGSLDHKLLTCLLVHVHYSYFIAAIKGLPSALTKDYLTAVETVPELVRTESDPRKFLRCERGNPWSAALRLVQNWTYRRKFFGDEYWLRPLRLRDGALRPEDVALLQTGAFLILTPPEPDRRQVMVVNLGRLQGLEDDGYSRQRITQYLCLTTLNDYTQQNGLDVLILIDGNGMRMRADQGRLFQATHNVSSFTVHQVILANDPAETRATLMHLFGMMMRRLAEKFWDKHGRLVNVACASTQLTREALQDNGLHPSTIPTELGGNFCYERHVKEFLAMRLLRELGAVAWPEKRDTTTAAASDDSVASYYEQAVTSPYVLSMDAGSMDPKEAQSFMAACSSASAASSMMPHHQPISDDSSHNEEDLHVHPTRSSSSNSSNLPPPRAPLRPPQPQPSKSCRGIFVSPAGEALRDQIAQPKEAIRKRNCAYSKRHYYKKKNAIKTLQNEVDELRKRQKQLRTEQDQLMNLLSQANQVVAAEADSPVDMVE